MSTESREADAPAGRPFAEEPHRLRPPGQGCSRMALAGCAVIVLLLGLGVLTLMLKGRQVVAWSLERVRQEIERTLPADLPAPERRRLEAAFEAAAGRLEDGELDAAAFEDLQGQLLHFAGLGRDPTRDEVGELAAALERFAGTEPPSAGTPPAQDRPRDDPAPDDRSPDDRSPDDRSPDDGATDRSDRF